MHRKARPEKIIEPPKPQKCGFFFFPKSVLGNIGKSSGHFHDNIRHVPYPLKGMAADKEDRPSAGRSMFVFNFNRYLSDYFLFSLLFCFTTAYAQSTTHRY